MESLKRRWKSGRDWPAKSSDLESGSEETSQKAAPGDREMGNTEEWLRDRKDQKKRFKIYPTGVS